MEKKYYDLIISLIKKHKRYVGLEAILDDIANYVYDNSINVLKDINDDLTKTSYLEKIISTSLITVPKRMNYNSKITHRIISKKEDVINEKEENLIDTDITPEISLEIQEAEIQPAEKETVLYEHSDVDKNLVDKMINGFSINETPTLEEEFEPAVEEIELAEEISFNDEDVITLDESAQIEEFEPAVEEIELAEEISFNDEDVISLDEATQVEEFEPAVEEIELAEEISFNDEDVISLDESAQIEEFEPAVEEIKLAEEISFNDEEEVSLDLDDATQVEEFEPAVEEIELAEEISFNDEKEVSLDLDEATQVEEFDPAVEEIKLAEEISFNDEDVISLDESAQIEEFEPAVEDFEEIKDFELSTDDNLSLNLEYEASEQIDFEVDNNIDLSITEINEPDMDIEKYSVDFEPTETSDESSADFSYEQPDFESFSFQTKRKTYNSDQISSIIEVVEHMNPEGQVSRICDLKYKQGLSIPEICDELKISPEGVLEILQKIVDEVKVL